MLKVRLTPAAEQDLIEIFEYIVSSNAMAALAQDDKLRATIGLLASTPYAGRSRDEVGHNVRSLAVKNHVLFYRPHAKEVVVLRVLHGARDLEAIFPGLDESSPPPSF